MKRPTIITVLANYYTPRELVVFAICAVLVVAAAVAVIAYATVHLLT